MDPKWHLQDFTWSIYLTRMTFVIFVWILFPKLLPSKSSTPRRSSNICVSNSIRAILKILVSFFNDLNVALQKHYAALQALALERENAEEVPDYVNPDLEGMDKVPNNLCSHWEYSHLMDTFAASVFPPGYEPNAKNAPKKRKLESNEEPSVDEGEMRKALEEKRVFFLLLC